MSPAVEKTRSLGTDVSPVCAYRHIGVMSSQMNCHIRSVSISILNAFCTMLAHSRSSIYCFISVVIVSSLTWNPKCSHTPDLNDAGASANSGQPSLSPPLAISAALLTPLLLSICMWRITSNRATHTRTWTEISETERFGCFFMYRATPSTRTSYMSKDQGNFGFSAHDPFKNNFWSSCSIIHLDQDNHR